jgi:hypothetical protein
LRRSAREVPSGRTNGNRGESSVGKERDGSDDRVDGGGSSGK